MTEEVTQDAATLNLLMHQIRSKIGESLQRAY